MADHTTPPIVPDVVTLSLSGWRVAINHAQSRRIVAVIEIVSPSNKAKIPEFKDLIGKSVQLLRQGIHVLLIDAIPANGAGPERHSRGGVERPHREVVRTTAGNH